MGTLAFTSDEPSGREDQWHRPAGWQDAAGEELVFHERAEVVTGPSVFRHHDKAASQRGRRMDGSCLDAAASSAASCNLLPVESDRNPDLSSTLATAGDLPIALAPAPPAVSRTAAPPPGRRQHQHPPPHGQHTLGAPLPRARHRWDGCAEADGIERRPGARTGRTARFSSRRRHRGTASCSVCRRDGLPPRPARRARGIARVRRNDRQGSEQQQRDEVVRFSGRLSAMGCNSTSAPATGRWRSFVDELALTASLLLGGASVNTMQTSRSRRSSIFANGTPGTSLRSSSDLQGPLLLRQAMSAADSFLSSPATLSSSTAVAEFRLMGFGASPLKFVTR